MKVRINGYEVEGTEDEIRRLIGAPQEAPVYPYQPQPYVPVGPWPYQPEPFNPYWPLPVVWSTTGTPPAIYGTSTTLAPSYAQMGGVVELPSGTVFN